MAFAFVRIVVPGQPAANVYQVRLDGPAGRLLGSVTEQDGYWQADTVVAGKLHTQPFPDRDRAAAWLLEIAPRMKR